MKVCKQESDVIKALQQVVEYLDEKFGQKIVIAHETQWYLHDIAEELKYTYPDIDFHYHFRSSCIRPDGGILHILGKPGNKLIYPILIAEVKNCEVPKDCQNRHEEMQLSVSARI